MTVLWLLLVVAIAAIGVYAGRLVVQYILSALIDWCDDKDTDSDQVQFCPRVAEIQALSIEDAHQRVEDLLREGRLLGEPSVERHREIVAALPTHLRDLFQRFDSVTAANGLAYVGPAYIHAKSAGEVLEVGGSDDESIHVQGSGETIYSIGTVNFTRVAPTVLHWLLLADFETAD